MLLDSALARLRDEGHVVWGFVVKPDQNELQFETFCSATASRAKFEKMTVDALSVLGSAYIKATEVEEDEYKLVGNDGKENLA